MHRQHTHTHTRAQPTTMPHDAHTFTPPDPDSHPMRHLNTTTNQPQPTIRTNHTHTLPFLLDLSIIQPPPETTKPGNESSPAQQTLTTLHPTTTTPTAPHPCQRKNKNPQKVKHQNTEQPKCRIPSPPPPPPPTQTQTKNPNNPKHPHSALRPRRRAKVGSIVRLIRREG